MANRCPNRLHERQTQTPSICPSRGAQQQRLTRAVRSVWHSPFVELRFAERTHTCLINGVAATFEQTASIAPSQRQLQIVDINSPPMTYRGQLVTL